MGELPVDDYVLFTRDEKFILYIEENILYIYQSTSKYLAKDVLDNFALNAFKRWYISI
ncbi:hypothetical protein ACN7UQ_01830 [Aerococcus urinaeequi]